LWKFEKRAEPKLRGKLENLDRVYKIINYKQNNLKFKELKEIEEINYKSFVRKRYKTKNLNI